MLIAVACALVSFVLGAVISAVNYAISRRILTTKPEIYASTTIIRQFCSVAYLVVAYFVGSRWFADNIMGILVGAALGITVSSFFFTAKLMRLNSAKNEENEKGKGEE